MRICVLALAACGAPPVATPSTLIAGDCDPGSWFKTNHRLAWLVSSAAPTHHHERPMPADAPFDHAPLSVLEIDGDDVLLADMQAHVFVTRWAPITALGHAVTSEVLVSPAPGAPGDDSLRLLPGLRIAGEGAWREVTNVEGIQLRGWIPASAVGTTFYETAPPSLQTSALAAPVELHRASTVDSPIAAVLSAGVQVASRLELDWRVVTAITPHAIALGYAQRVSTEVNLEHTYVPREMSYPPGLCLYDAPGGAAVGIVRGPISAPPMPSDVPGWFTVDIETAFGRQHLFTDRIPRSMVLPD